MNPGISEEIGETTRSFMDILRQQPLSLALVVMNFLLVAYVFYSGGAILEQRKWATALIVDWQKESDKLMSQCVSPEMTKIVLDNLTKMTETLLLVRKPIELPAPAPAPAPSPAPMPEK